MKFKKGDRARFKPKSPILQQFDVDEDEVGTVTAVEGDPPAKHSDYRISVRFSRTIVPGVPSEHFDIIE